MPTLRRAGAAALAAAGLLAAATVGAPSVAQAKSPSLHSGLDHVFVIMLENHSDHSVIDQRDSKGKLVAPYITQLAHTYARADHYYGVTHPSEPNYIAAIGGSTFGVTSDDPTTVLDERNLVDQLEANGLTWNAYMEAMDPNDKLAATAPGKNALYAIKHNPFVLFSDIRNDPARMQHVKTGDALAADLASGDIANFVWISPDQCNDMHGGVYATIQDRPETPCGYGDAVNTDVNDVDLQHKADAFVQTTVQEIMGSAAWSQNSAIFVVADENDYDGTNATTGDWESAAGCCDSPYRAPGTVSDSWPGGVYGGGEVPAILITTHNRHPFVSHHEYNHYSFLATIEKLWHLGYLNDAGDRRNVPTMDDLFAH